MMEVQPSAHHYAGAAVMTVCRVRQAGFQKSHGCAGFAAGKAERAVPLRVPKTA
jgi:hypothetical protein